jgi:hypothetical protein
VIETAVLSSIVSNWLYAIAKDILLTIRRDRWGDFEVRDPS